MEIWKTLPGTKGFIEISNEGRVRSFLRGEERILKTQTDQKGYQRFSITIDRHKTTYKLHREVAKAFVPNDNNLPQVNHKNGNKNDNTAANLEWVSNLENARHAVENGLWANVFKASRETAERLRKPIVAYRIEDGAYSFMYFSSISEAEREFDSRHICDVLKGKREKVKGWGFLYCKRGGDHYSYSKTAEA